MFRSVPSTVPKLAPRDPFPRSYIRGTRNAGHHNPRTNMKPNPRIGRKPHPHVCTCQQTILTAWDAPQAALLTHLDPWALTKAGELWAIDQGLRTYHLNPNGIHRRDRWNRAKPPAPNHVVLAQHKCGQLIPEQHRMNRPKPQRATAQPVTDNPPF